MCRLEVSFIDGKVLFPNPPSAPGFPQFQPGSMPWAKSSMYRGGGSGGGTGFSVVLRIGIAPHEGGCAEIDVREEDSGEDRRLSQLELKSETRIEGGDVKRGLSMLGHGSPRAGHPRHQRETSFQKREGRRSIVIRVPRGMCGDGRPLTS